MTCPFAETTECKVKQFYRQNFLINHLVRKLRGKLSGFEHRHFAGNMRNTGLEISSTLA